MVMHARKIQRLDDGFYEKHKAHPFEDAPSKSHSHFNNSRYTERSKNKREDSRANQRHHNSKPGSSSNSSEVQRSSHSNHDRNHREGRDRGQKERDHKAEVRKSAVRVCRDWSEHISSSSKRYYYNCKSEVSQWERPKDWDDMLSTKVNREGREKHNSGTSHDSHRHSSSGKRHSEHLVSKGTSAATALSRHHTEQAVSSQNSSSSNHGNGNPSSSSLSSSSHDKHKQSHTGQRTGLSQHKAWHGHEQHHKTQSPQFNRRDGRTEMGCERRREGGTTPSSTTPGGTRTSNTTPGSVVGGNGNYPTDDVAARYKDMDYRVMSGRQVPDSQQSEDMDISPGSTPTEESMMERISFSALSPGSATTPTSTQGPMSAATAGAIASLPQLIQQLNDKNQVKVDSQQLTQQAMDTLQKLQRVVLQQQQQKLQAQLLKTLQDQLVQETVSKAAVSSAAIHTLQKLQQALLAQQQQRLMQHTPGKDSRTGATGGSPPSPTESDGTPLGSPEYHGDDHENSLLDRSPRASDRRAGSPTPSQGSSQGATVGTSKLAAAHRKGESTDITTSLSNYYNDKLLDHMSNWQGDITERQASRYYEEAHAVGSLHCTQISADLKKARSLVRIAEIKSTLQEQRILFLRHSVRDLDNMRIQNNFMSSEET